MCKRHWKSINNPDVTTNVNETPPSPQGESVYDTILPASIAFRPVQIARVSRQPWNMQQQSAVHSTSNAAWDSTGIYEMEVLTNAPAIAVPMVSTEITSSTTPSSSFDPLDPPRPPPGTCIMPLIAFLQRERHREPGWHRNAERRARGMFLVSNLSQPMEPWERQLVSE
jgi:hypothetical protein